MRYFYFLNNCKAGWIKVGIFTELLQKNSIADQSIDLISNFRGIEVGNKKIAVH